MSAGRQITAGEVEEGQEILLRAEPEYWGVVEDARPGDDPEHVRIEVYGRVTVHPVGRPVTVAA